MAERWGRGGVRGGGVAWSPAWTCVEVLVAVVIVLELVLVPAFRSWLPLCSRWNLCRGPGRRCARVGTSVGTCV